jgi:DME family drug/metabolite transporter
MTPTIRGYAAAIGCSFGLGLAVAVARCAFEGGTNGVTVALLRAWLVVLFIGVFCLATGRGLRLPWRQWWHCLWLGVLMANMFYANIAAVQFIPIGLAALLFFTYPPLVTIVASLWAWQWPGGGRIVALLVAFGGLVVMLGVSFTFMHPLGIALSLSAALAAAINMVGAGKLMAVGERWVLFWHMALVAAITLAMVGVASDSLVLPTMPSGWAGMIGVAFLQASSIPLFYLGIAHIGAERAAMFNNLQPVISILAAYALFAELLTPAQFVGAALVMGGIALMQWLDMRARPKAAMANSR